MSVSSSSSSSTSSVVSTSKIKLKASVAFKQQLPVVSAITGGNQELGISPIVIGIRKVVKKVESCILRRIE